MRSSAVRWFRPAALLVAAVMLVLVWSLAVLGVRVEEAVGPAGIRSWQGAAYTATVLTSAEYRWLDARDDADELSTRADLVLTEDGRSLGPAHAGSWTIASTGGGAYSYRGHRLVFSAADNSDPGHNGRAYRLATRLRLAWDRAALLSLLALAFGAAGWHAHRLRFRPDAAQQAHLATRHELRRMVAWALAAYAVRVVIFEADGLMRGPVFWIVLGAWAISFLLVLHYAGTWLFLQLGRSSRPQAFINTALVAGAVALSSAAMELVLATDGTAAPDWAAQPVVATPRLLGAAEAAGERTIRTGRASITLPADLIATIAQRHQRLSMPPEWVMQAVPLPGTTGASRWHGALHVFDADGFRRLDGPFPAKDPSRARIMIVGDSLTYGVGIAEEWSFPAQLQLLLERDLAVEVINLGVLGAQSEDIALTIARMTPILRPDLIVYAMFLNDFQPSGPPETSYTPGLLRLSLERTRLGRLIDDAHRNIVIRLGFSLDIWDDILRGIDTYQKRFAADLAHMRSVALAQGLPPIVGMVLDHLPVQGGRGQRLARIAEDAMRQAGFDVIPTDPYYHAYDGRALFVSRWEYHPNEEAHAIFATMIADHMLGRGDLEKFRRAPSRSQ